MHYPGQHERPNGREPGSRAPDTEKSSNGGPVSEQELQLEVKDRHIKELYEELARAKAALEEMRVKLLVTEADDAAFRQQLAGLREQVLALRQEERELRRHAEQRERVILDLNSELKQLEEEMEHKDRLLDEWERHVEEVSSEAQRRAERKDAALEDALRRVDGLSRDLEERETEISRLEAVVQELQERFEGEDAVRRRLSIPANRIRSGIELFNGDEHAREVASISKSLEDPTVHVELGDGEEPPVFLTFNWGNMAWRRYASNPGLDVQEPRVYLQEMGDDIRSVRHHSANARVDTGGRVQLGL